MEGGTYSSIYPGVFAFDGGLGRTDLSKKDSLAYPYDPQTSEEVYPADLKSSLLPDPIHGINGSGTTYPESVGLSTVLRHEDDPHALKKDQYSPVDTTLHVKVSSTLTDILRKKRASVSFQPARRAGGIRGAPELSYSCDVCGEQYSQPQGVSRHRRRAHNPHSCLCCGFKWSRPYQYRDHLEKHHPYVDRDYVLGKRAGSRRRSTIIGRDLPHHIPLPAIEPDGAEFQRPLAPPLSTLTKAIHVSSPAMSPVSYDPQLNYADSEQAITMKRFEKVRGLEYQFPGAIDPPTFPSGESIQSVTTWTFPLEVAKFGYRQPSRQPTLVDSLLTAHLAQ